MASVARTAAFTAAHAKAEMSGTQIGGSLLGPNGQELQPKHDDKGRVLKHNATIGEVHQIVAEDTSKVHEYYLNQIPGFTGQMIHDALMSFGLVKVVAGEGGVPTVVGHQDPREPMTDEQVKAFRDLLATAKAPAVSENAGRDTPPADTTTSADVDGAQRSWLANDEPEPTP